MNESKCAERLLWVDICKLVAIFLVTIGHCSQALSGLDFPPIFGTPGLLIAIHMPLFMLMSGFFINIDKLRNQSLGELVLSKFKRLLIPSMIWYLLFCLITLSRPNFFTGVNYYWYLNCLFVCFIIIWLVIRVSKNNFWGGVIFSILLVIFCPYSSFLKINFMYPFLWAGYLLKRIINSNWFITNKIVILGVSAVVSFLLYTFWDYNYSVYISPFDTIHFSLRTLIVYFYRFAIGLFSSLVVVLLVQMVTTKTGRISRLAKYGNVTLFIYVSSFLINAVVSHFLRYFDANITSVGLLNTISIIYTVIIILTCRIFAQFIRKNKIASQLLLGE